MPSLNKRWSLNVLGDKCNTGQVEKLTCRWRSLTALHQNRSQIVETMAI